MRLTTRMDNALDDHSSKPCPALIAASMQMSSAAAAGLLCVCGQPHIQKTRRGGRTILAVPAWLVPLATASDGGVEAWESGWLLREQVRLAEGGALVRDVLQAMDGAMDGTCVPMAHGGGGSKEAHVAFPTRGQISGWITGIRQFRRQQGLTGSSPRIASFPLLFFTQAAPK